ncbi:hypothetical protein D3P07_11650 [Paenibacillus sp. 1011MAR3C5]|uniref:hypothetical protein n=1 Tax=Paenibacillus sp. 1011MAR3C5 TaxID=1675787 RepID=UPI000E6C6ED8|nr:hypothetical protein [Paenibacillus sp. 1011MAR3C5]RJE88641.1 hypothetical protein D3P07_11650 [Paenibacillus sp. 1011MAR3C5]
MFENRYVASPYSYHDSGRVRSWSVWDRKNNCWAAADGDGVRMIGTKKDVLALAQKLTDAGTVDHGSDPSDDINQYLPI